MTLYLTINMPNLVIDYLNLKLNMAGEEKEREVGACFLPEKDNPYPLCMGRGRAECEECQLRVDWEPDDPYGVGA